MNAAATLTDNAQMAVTAPREGAFGKTSDVTKAKATAKNFEAMFMTQMLNHMFAGLDQDKGVFGGGHAESMFRPMLLDEYGKMIANRGKGIGLADQVSKALLAHQEV